LSGQKLGGYNGAGMEDQHTALYARYDGIQTTSLTTVLSLAFKWML